MTRSLLTLLLLLHYLLVGCASVSAQARDERLPARPLAYVHSHGCQLRNAWRGGRCFEDCNGVQYRVHKNHKPQSLPELLASARGMDLHCLPAPGFAAASACLAGLPSQPGPGRAVAVPAGVRGRVHAPPRQG